jgi:uncharacterized metal-binding protein YceD (DUF177 family)
MSAAPPFSRPLRVDALPGKGATQSIEADADERAALAKLNHLPAIASLSATFRLSPGGRDGVRVTGDIRAEVTRVCIVTLEPFTSHVEEPVDLLFSPPAKEEPPRGAGAEKEKDLDLTAEDPPDVIVDGVIDLGALAAEFLALGLDPYPRKPGVAFAAPAVAVDEASPFAALAGLKTKAKPKKKR